MFDASVNLSKMCIGAGILALPYATVEGGLLSSGVLMLWVAVLNGFSCCMLLRSKKVLSEYSDEDKIPPPSISSTYAKLAYASCGWPGVYVVDASIILTLLGVCVTYTITFSQLMAEIWPMPFNEHVLLFSLIVYPVCCVRNVSRLASFSFVGIIFLLLSVLVIVLYGYYSFGFPSDGTVPFGGGVPLFAKNISGLLGYVGVATFCIDLVTPIFPIEESLEKKRDIYAALIVSLFFIWITYVAFADITALFFYNNRGSVLKTNILLNLPSNGFIGGMVRVCMAAVCVLTYPLTLMLSAQMIENVIVNFYPVCAEKERQTEPFFSISDQISPMDSMLSMNSTSGGVELGLQHEYKDPVDSSLNKKNNKYGSINSPSPFNHTTTGFHSSPGRSFQVGLHTPGNNHNYSSRGNNNEYNAEIEEEDEIPDMLKPNFATRCLNRLVLVFVTIIIAVSVPCFALVISFLGCCTVSILTYIMPPFIHSRIVTKKLLTKNPDVVHMPMFDTDLIDPITQNVLDNIYYWFGILFCVVSTSLTGLSVYFTLAEGGNC